MTLNVLVNGSKARSRFRDALADFLASGMPNDAISFDRRSPPVKVERVLAKLLESEPHLEIEKIEVAGSSGCAFYRGEVTVGDGDEVRRFRFDWDCRWRALEQGWTDFFGFPDQIRAAREFGHDCFREWEEVRA
jgi:hypothetical protein